MLRVAVVRILSYGQGGAPSLASPCRPPHTPRLAWAFSLASKKRRTAEEDGLGAPLRLCLARLAPWPRTLPVTLARGLSGVDRNQVQINLNERLTPMSRKLSHRSVRTRAGIRAPARGDWPWRSWRIGICSPRCWSAIWGTAGRGRLARGDRSRQRQWRARRHPLFPRPRGHNPAHGGAALALDRHDDCRRFRAITIVAEHGRRHAGVSDLQSHVHGRGCRCRPGDHGRSGQLRRRHLA